MSDYYVGEIRIFAGNYAPEGWNMCDGSLLSISQYQLLFSLIGTTYGGNGTTTFALPDFRGRLPVGQGQGTNLANYTLGQHAGTEQVTLQTGMIPSHNHPFNVTNAQATTITPGPSVMLASTAGEVVDIPFMNYQTYSSTDTPLYPLAAQAVLPGGGGQAHANMMPFMTVSFIIAATNGIYPTRPSS